MISESVVGILIAVAFTLGGCFGWWAGGRRSEPGHLCHHVNGAHRCVCRRGEDHGDGYHNDMTRVEN